MTFYEQVGIVIPGSVLIVGLLFYFPALNAFVAKDGVTLGQFGIFLLLSYAAGHFIAALGNVLEKVLWRPFGGMPSDWVTKQKSALLSPQQIAALEAKVTSRLNMNVGVVERGSQSVVADLPPDLCRHREEWQSRADRHV